MSNPLVSILTPTYNHQEFIGSCLEGMLAQTYPHWQAIVVDDASTDGTWEVVQEFAQRDPRIQAYRQRHLGLERLVDTYNFALDSSDGELIAILEGDDRWPPDKLSQQVARHTGDIDFSCGHTGIIDAAGNFMTNFMPLTPPGVYTFDAFFKEYVLRRTALIPVSVMVSRRALESIGGFVQHEEYPAVDYSTFSTLLSTPDFDRKAVLDARVWGYWRTHNSNVTKIREATIVSGVYSLALKRVRALPANVRERLELDESTLFRAHEPYLAGVYLSLMRQGLIRRDRRQVHQYASKLWKLKLVKRRLQALFGLMLSGLGLNMERVFRWYEALKLPRGGKRGL